MTTSSKTTRTILLTGLLTALSGLPAAAADGEYHLTGVMGTDAGQAFAVVELADGQQTLLTEGSAIGNGHVKSISSKAKTVLLAFPDGEVLLTLTGSATPGDYRDERSDDFDATDEFLVQKMLDRPAIASLLALAGKASQIGENALSTQLNKLLGLPEQARISAFNEQPVKSVHKFMQMLEQQLPDRVAHGGNLGALAVSHEEVTRRVYLFAEGSAEQPQDAQ